MTDQEQRIAIAEACGWKRVRAHWELNNQIAFLNDSPNHRQLPDYLNDLNAMHEAEGTLTDAQVQQYVEHLIEVTSAKTMLKFGITSVNYWSIYHATARQRSEAFCRTIEKWIE